jgi:branched-chain amino acid transport system ATP-binding protein
MLEISGLRAFYGTAQVLWDVNLRVGEREIVAVMGPNGSGKSTILKAIMGLVPDRQGHIAFCNQDLSVVPTHALIRHGVSFVLERRRLFPMMTVEENLKMGAYSCGSDFDYDQSVTWLESLFPLLRSRRRYLAGRLSGGEQQMVAIARGLVSRPRLLLLDEPFLGLAPRVVDEVVELIKTINDQGISVLFNEQNVHLSFGTAHRGYVLESGRVVLEGAGLDMLNSDLIKRIYLGEGRQA